MYELLEWVAGALIVSATLLIVIGIHRSAPPAPDRTEERARMRRERRRAGKE